MSDNEIKKALECCTIGNCRRCPLACVHNCRTQLREGMNNILSKQQLELVLKRNTINDLNNKLTEKQSENEKLQSLCTSKDVIIKEQQAEIERLQGAVQEWVDGKCLSQKHLLMIGNLQNEIEQAKSEAIKEFAERFIDEECAYCSSGSDEMIFFEKRFDNFLAKMVGGENA